MVEPLEGRRLLSTTLPTTVVTTPPAVITVPVTKTIGTGVTINPVPHVQFSGVVGTLTDVANVASDFSNLHASINWGDGTTSAGTFSRPVIYAEPLATSSTSGAASATSVVPIDPIRPIPPIGPILPNGPININGTHTYVNTGTFKITITITEGPIVAPGKPVPQYIALLGTISSTAKVAENSPGGVTLVEYAGDKFNAQVATAPYPPPLWGPILGVGPVVPIDATINWGDGVTSTGTATDNGKGELNVTGTHTYAKGGAYRITVTLYRAFVGVQPETNTPSAISIFPYPYTPDVVYSTALVFADGPVT